MNHKDGNKGNNYRSNLEWCTAKENCDHRDNILGKHLRGERHPNAELTEQQVIRIKDLCKEGKLTQQQIADKYGVCQTRISQIKLGKAWNYL